MSVNDTNMPAPQEEPYTLSQLFADYGVSTDDTEEQDDFPQDDGHRHNEISCAYTRDQWPEPGRIRPGHQCDATLYAAYAEANTRIMAALHDLVSESIRDVNNTVSLANIALQVAQMHRTHHLIQHLPCHMPEEQAERLYDQAAAVAIRATELIGPSQAEVAEQDMFQYLINSFLNDEEPSPEDPMYQQFQPALRAAGHSWIIAANDVAQQMNHLHAQADCSARRDALRHMIFELYHSLPDDIKDDDLPENHQVSQALRDISDTFHDHQEAFNANLATTFSPSLRNLTRKLNRYNLSMPIDSVGHNIGALGNEHTFFPFAVFYHEGGRRCQAMCDPYPAGFPQEVAMRHYISIAEAFSRKPLGPQEEIVAQAHDRIRIAAVGCHTVEPGNIRALMDILRELDLPQSAILPMLCSAADGDNETTRALFNTAELDYPLVSKEAAQNVIEAGRRNGLDDIQLALLAIAMAWNDYRELGVRPPTPDDQQATMLRQAATMAGFPAECADRMVEHLTNLGD